MPANNRKQSRAKVTRIVSGGSPITGAPAAIFQKTLQDALIDGFKDPVCFARDFLDIEPYPDQQTFLRNSKDCVESNFVAGNRVGKTWLSGLILLWKAFYRHISPFLMPEHISPHVTYKAVSTSLTHDQAKLAWTYALTFTESKRFRPFLGDVVHSPFPTMNIRTKNEKGDWVFSEVWARSLAKGGVYLLGHSISFLLADECAYVPKYMQIEDEVLRMRLADQGGSILRISTPNGRNFFYDKYLAGTRGDPKVYSQRVPTTANPYVARRFLDEAKERMLPEYYAQNVLAEFVSMSDFFRIENIQALYADVDETLPIEYNPKGRYVLGADLGAQQDPTVVMVLRIDTIPAQLVYVAEVKNTNWDYARGLVVQAYQTYRPEVSVIDATGTGDSVVQRLVNEHNLEGVERFIFSATSKPEVLFDLQEAVQRKRFVMPYGEATRELIRQLSFYRLDDKKLTQDHVIALALVNRAFTSATKNRGMSTQIYDDLSFISVRSHGREIVGLDNSEVGNLFTFDPTSGLLVPLGIETTMREYLEV